MAETDGICLDASCTKRHSLVTIDPEVATLTANLGSAGTSATALQTDGVTTLAYNAPCATCTPRYAPTMPIGNPCNPASALTGTVLDKVVSPVYGSSGSLLVGYRRCVAPTQSLTKP